MLSSQIGAFLKQASLTAKIKGTPSETLRITAVIVTPNGQYTSLGVERFSEVGDFISNRADMVMIRVRLQPSVYFEKIVPYRDDLEIKLIVRGDSGSILREFVAVPAIDRDLKVESNNTGMSDLSALDVTELVPYEFQLIDKGFNKLKNIPISKIYLMGNVQDVILDIMETSTKSAGLTGYETYKGMFFYTPVDNPNKYAQIVIPNGMKLINVPLYLQNHNEYGVYTKGLGCYYKQNYWYVYPLFNINLVDKHHCPLDIIRVPENKIPTLDSTFYKTSNGITIIATGKSSQRDFSDIRKQNEGVGKRVIMGDAIAGDTGYHYNNGRAITTRADSLQEYQLSERRNGQDWIPLDTDPTGNMCRALSSNALNEGEIIEVEWHNGDVGYLEPGHPLRYQYILDGETMTTRPGVLLGYKSDYVAITAHGEPVLKRTTVLTLFLQKQSKYKN